MAHQITVMATGAFDILHMGHIYFLKEAKKLGDKLVVVIARDATIRRLKHEPVTQEEIRLGLIKELRIVDEAYLGSTEDMYAILDKIQPDIIAIGYDQIHDIKELSTELKKRGPPKTKIIRLSKFEGGSDLNGTRRIIQKIIAAYGFQKEMERMQDELAEKEIVHSAGGGMVSATVNGKMELVDIKIEKEVIDPDDPELLEDMIIAAVNGAISEANEMAQQEMARLTGGLGAGIPGLGI